MTNGRIKVCLFQKKALGWHQLVLHTNLVEKYIIDGHITFMCGVIVVNDRSIPVSPSNIGKHLATLLDSTDGIDVSFIIESEMFHAHRAVLAARSFVFKAELLGSMAEAAMPSITLHEVSPATFKVMLWFIYTYVFPRDDEHGESPNDMIRNLLVVVDRG
jgi:speckle-type POZ protein